MSPTESDLLRTDIATIQGLLEPPRCEAWIATAEASGFEDATVNTRKGQIRDQALRNNSRVIRDDPSLATML